MMKNAHVLMAAIGALTLAACGGGDEAKEQQLEDYAAQHGVDADVELDEKGEVKSVTVNNANGARVGQDLSLPDGFPDDVHVSDNWSVMATSPVPQGGFMLNATTPESAEATLSAIRQAMLAKGWAVEAETQSGAMMTQIGFVKDDRLASFNLMDTGGAALNVQLVTMKKPN